MNQNNSVFFILGAGASADTGLSTYRGQNGLYTNSEKCTSEDPLVNPIHKLSLLDPERMYSLWKEVEPILFHTSTELGPTYQKIQEICGQYEQAMIVTQNVDSLALKLSDRATIVELHGNNRTMSCLECGERVPIQIDQYICPRDGSYMRPDITLFGEMIDQSTIQLIHRFVKRTRPSVCYVIGTTLQFKYLTDMIKLVKKNAGRIIHVNPDPNYTEHAYRVKWNNVTRSYRQVQKDKPEGLWTPEQFLNN